MSLLRRRTVCSGVLAPSMRLSTTLSARRRPQPAADEVESVDAEGEGTRHVEADEARAAACAILAVDWWLASAPRLLLVIVVAMGSGAMAFERM